MHLGREGELGTRPPGFQRGEQGGQCATPGGGVCRRRGTCGEAALPHGRHGGVPWECVGLCRAVVGECELPLPVLWRSRQENCLVVVLTACGRVGLISWHIHS